MFQLGFLSILFKRLIIIGVQCLLYIKHSHYSAACLTYFLTELGLENSFLYHQPIYISFLFLLIQASPKIFCSKLLSQNHGSKFKDFLTRNHGVRSRSKDGFISLKCKSCLRSDVVYFWHTCAQQGKLL